MGFSADCISVHFGPFTYDSEFSAVYEKLNSMAKEGIE